MHSIFLRFIRDLLILLCIAWVTEIAFLLAMIELPGGDSLNIGINPRIPTLLAVLGACALTGFRSRKPVDSGGQR